MAEIVLDTRHQAVPGRLRGRQGAGPRHRRRRVRDPRRPVGLREVDGAADDRRARGHHRRRAADRRRRGQRQGAEGPRHRDGVPELRALPAHDRARQHGLRAQAREGAQGGDQQEGRRGRAHPRPRRSTSTASRRTCPAASASAWPWAARSCATRRRSSWTSRSPTSTRSCACRCAPRSRASRTGSGTTTVYVTHDQTEAMTLGDRVAVMRAGVLQQVGSPKELYDTPVNIFVAGFIGSPAMNFMPAQLEGDVAKLPMADVPLTDTACARGLAARTAAGARDRRACGRRTSRTPRWSATRGDRGVTFKAKIDLLESMGSELYAYFAHRGQGGHASPPSCRSSPEDAGTAEVPGGGAEQVVARLSMPRARCSRARRPSCGSTPTSCTSSTPRAGKRAHFRLSRSSTSSLHSCVRSSR